MARQYKCISGDGHIDLNPDIWRDRVQAKYRERAPKRVKMPNGSDAVVIDGGKPNTIGITRSVRVAHADLAKQVPTFETCAGTGTPEQRLAEQDQDGIDCEILFSQITFVLRQTKDDDFYRDCIRAYNEFLGAEYSAPAPDRLVCMGTLPTTGVDDAIKEMEHCAKLGMKGVKLDRYPSGKTLSDVRRRQVLGRRARSAHGAHQSQYRHHGVGQRRARLSLRQESRSRCPSKRRV